MIPFDGGDWEFWRLVEIVVELSQRDASQEAAATALVEVIQWHERLSGSFLIAADRLEHLVDCSSYNICREDLETEAYARALPNTYQLNDDLVIHTVLDRSAVNRFAQGAREIKARFHRLTETDEDVRTHLDTFRVRAYGSYQDYYTRWSDTSLRGSILAACIREAITAKA